MAKISVTELQEKLDVSKWTDSEAKGMDTCGEYDYCKFCSKTEENPCANAFMKAEKPAVAKKTSAKKSTEKKTTEKKTTAKRSTSKKSVAKN